jgi:hypothetical protein
MEQYCKEDWSQLALNRSVSGLLLTQLLTAANSEYLKNLQLYKKIPSVIELLSN